MPGCVRWIDLILIPGIADVRARGTGAIRSVGGNSPEPGVDVREDKGGLVPLSMVRTWESSELCAESNVLIAQRG